MLGRFGYTPFPDVPGFHVEPSGFRSSSPGADRFRFDRPLTGFTGYSITDRSALSLGPYYDSCPSQIRYNLRSPGFEMYFPRSVRLWLGSLQSPILSWEGGSAGADVPTPPSKWFLVSFEERQPPVLLVFEDSPAQLIVRGTAGKWSVTTNPGYRGWLRVCLPLGHQRSAALNVASLGEQVHRVTEDLDFWTLPPPNLDGYSVKSDETSLTVIWTFDRPGAQVPVPALMAKSGGYPIQVLTGIKRVGADLIDGPVAYTTEPRFAVKFPLQRVPSGRSLTLGARPSVPYGDISPFSVPGLCNLALEVLLPDRDVELVSLTQAATDEFYARSRGFVEPFTKQRLPYSQGGDGLDVLAAHALVQQARALGGETAGNADDPYLHTSQRVDWATWTVWANDQGVSRRATGIFSVAAALSNDPERRALGAMLQAGLASQRALSIYREVRKYAVPKLDLLEPLYSLRDGLFLSGRNDFVSSLLSEVRITSQQSLTAEPVEEGVIVRFVPSATSINRLEFEVGRPVSVEPVSNVRSLLSNQFLGRLTVDCTSIKIGECAFLIKSPGWAVLFPQTIAPPVYSEAR